MVRFSKKQIQDFFEKIGLSSQSQRDQYLRYTQSKKETKILQKQFVLRLDSSTYPIEKEESNA